MTATKEAIWMYRAVLTMTAVGGGDLSLTIAPGTGNYIKIKSLLTGADDYSGAEDVTILHRDPTNLVCYYAVVSVDNQRITLPCADTALAANSIISVAKEDWIIQGPDTLVISTSALIQNETLTVTIRARIKAGAVPTCTAASTGTVSVATTYNKIV